MKALTDFIHLTPIQEKVLKILNEHAVFYDHFYFIGGTLLKALGIVPRESNDLDFFTFHTVQLSEFPRIMNAVKTILEKEFGEQSLENALKGFRHRESGMMMEFIQDALPPIDRFISYENIQTASLKDIAAGKASALCTRDELKDMVDIALLTKHQHWRLKDLAEFAEQKFRIGTMPEEKLFQELLAKKNLFDIRPQMFIYDGEKTAKIAAQQIDFLLHSTSL